MASKRSRSAPIWNYMELTTPDVATCLTCKDTFKYSGSTTSNLIKHLRTKHPLDFAEMKEESDSCVPAKSSKPSTSTVQPTLMDTLNKATPYKSDSAKKKDLDELLIRMVVQDLQPISVVEDKGFRGLVHGLNPRYDLPSRREISRTLLPSAYKNEVERVKKELEKAKHISLTTDIWTSRQTKGYLTVTAHYISPEWALQSAVLDTVCMSTAHTAENIAAEVQVICRKWNIMDKVCSIVTDSAANMIAAVNALKVKQIPCFAHKLNLVVQDAIKNTPDVQKVKEKVKDIVSFFHHSVKASDRLAQLQKQHNQPVKKLIQDVETRWNSTYYMMERYLEQNELVTTTLCLLHKNALCLNDDEITLLQSTVNALEQFEEATKEMSTEKVTSLSKIIPMVRGLQGFLNSCVDTDNQIGRQLIRQMERRFSVIEGNFFLEASAFLDPRFKRVPFGGESNSKSTEEHLVSLMRSEEESEPSTSQKPTKPLNTMPQERKKNFWSDFDNKIMEQMSHTSSKPTTGPYIEMRRYLEEPHIHRKEDPLAWWKEHATLFPKLQALAKRFLCIPASSVPSERLFSKAGELISHRRSSLKEKNVNMILFLNKNL